MNIKYKCAFIPGIFHFIPAIFIKFANLHQICIILVLLWKSMNLNILGILADNDSYLKIIKRNFFKFYVI